MLHREARAIAHLVAMWPPSAFPVAYLASGLVEDGRGDVGHSLVMAELRRRGGRVVLHELATTDGIDVAGDLLLEETWLRLRAAGFRSLLCANLLEHLEDRRRLVELVQQHLPPGGYLLVTVPRRYPYHTDPIDTRYRPTPVQLAAAFEGLELVDERLVWSSPALLRLVREPRLIAIKLRKAFQPGRQLGRGVPGTANRRAPLSWNLCAALLPAQVSVATLRQPVKAMSGALR